MKTIGYITAMAAIVVMAAPALARDRDRDRYERRERDRIEDARSRRPDTCKPLMKERGDRAANRETAIANAFKAWEIGAKNSYGVPYAKSENAWTDPKGPTDNPNCYDDKERWLKKWECTWEAAPCIK